MLSSISQPLRARSSITSAIGCISGPSGLSRNPPCSFQLLEPPLPFLVLLVPQDCVQYLGRVRMQLGPFFREFLGQASDSSSSHVTLQDSDQVGRLSGTEARSRPGRSLPLRLVTLVGCLPGKSSFCFPCLSSETSSGSGIQRFLPASKRFHCYASQQPDLCLVQGSFLGPFL